MSAFGSRLKAARLAAGLSQEQLGIQAGIEEASASARMNRYERGTRVPGLEWVERFGVVLNLPMAYFFAEDDDEAELLKAFHLLSDEGRKRLLASARKLAK
ncbi:helix-turn-helix domain-containing protein [Pseudoduganella sp. S-14]|uniref:helix-turn-helix domain-containing protein n=1 Tax=Pseudoduganella sp. S-14 TaxID=3404065 RepID=UPI003CEFFE6D